MNKTMKKISAVSAAVLAVAVMATAAFAADYVDNSGSSSATTSSTSEKIDDAVATLTGESSETEEQVVQVEVSNTANLNISADVMKALSGTTGTLEIVSPKMRIAIDASTIEKVGKINLSSTVSNTKSSTVVDFKSTKDFNCEIRVVVTSCKMSAEALAKAHVYCNGVDLGPVELDEDGNPVIIVTKGGKYEIK